MTGDFPTISSADHTHTIYGLNNISTPLGTVVATTAAAPFFAHGQIINDDWNAGLPVRRITAGMVAPAPIQHLRQDKPTMAAAPSRRLVQVFIADPDENVPLDKSLLYSGEQKLTDATDQELFFEIDIKTILEKHNAERVLWVNKKVKERTESLEPVKIRDLRMVVVNVATF